MMIGAVGFFDTQFVKIDDFVISNKNWLTVGDQSFSITIYEMK
jgi:hypothetical protein